MNKQNLIIYDFNELFSILNEINKDLSFNLVNISKREFPDLNLNELNSYLIITKKEISKLQNQIVLRNFPLKMNKIIEAININFLKIKFNQQSHINIGNYKLHLNSRKMFDSKKDLDLTEKEADIIIFLKNSKKPVSIDELQTHVWGHSSKLETHTVETHIYRLRKKITEKFMDDKFILNNKDGYYL